MKSCNVCLTEKPLEEFHKHGTTYRAQCKPCRSQARKFYSNGTKRSEYKYNPEKDRERKFKYHYGITVAEYDAMHESQGGLCKICQRPENGKRLSVDHCHTTGRVRGLLCAPCNQAIGMLQDSPVILQAAIDYLDK